MGFIKKIFGAIFGLIASLLKVVGVGKKSEYFLEIDEPQTASAAKQQPQAEEQAAPASTPEPAAATAIESSNGSKPAAQPAAEPDEPIAVLTQNGATPAPMAVAAATASKADTTFAPEYLNPARNQTRRRRPGANMGSFMSMAKNVKVSGS